jgi:Ribbon-helix-helix protein, copG family
MKRTTVSLPDDLAQRVEAEAARRRTSVSELVRSALIAHLQLDKSPFEGIIGIFEGDGSWPNAADLEDWLDATWADDIARDSGLRQRAPDRRG